MSGDKRGNMYEREENKWSKGLSCVSQVLPVVLAVDTLQPGPLVATVCAPPTGTLEHPAREQSCEPLRYPSAIK